MVSDEDSLCGHFTPWTGVFLPGSWVHVLLLQLSEGVNALALVTLVFLRCKYPNPFFWCFFPSSFLCKWL